MLYIDTPKAVVLSYTLCKCHREIMIPTPTPCGVTSITQI